MHRSYSIPCALGPSQLKPVWRDLCLSINYLSPSRDVAWATEGGIVCAGWDALPPWLKRIDIQARDGKVEAHVEAEASPAEIDGMAGPIMEELSGIFSHPVRPFPKRVFCVGWQKTGTTSLIEALRMLGLFSWHFSPWVIGHRHFRCEAGAERIDFDAIADYTALADLPVAALYRELDQAFPGSLFILTTRDADAWLDSALCMARRLLEKDGCLHSVERWAYGTDTIDAALFRDRFVRHGEQVREYFAGRPDFMAIDLAQGNPWEALCGFLRLPTPGRPFPRLNHRAGVISN